MTTAKQKIKKCVEDYIELFPGEWGEFLVMMDDLKGGLKDEEFATVKESGNEMRALFEMPATLHNLITNRLTVEELEWFKAGTASNKNVGGRWFATQFPKFRLPASV